MDQKWTYDLSSLLRLHKPHHVLVTCKGSDNGFIEYQNAIAARFSQQPVVWKRHGKSSQYSLTFPIKFCAFDENLCFGPHMLQSDLPNIAYLHIYVIDSASVDEYRTSVRHNVSEWFAKVSSKSDVQWLIIIDSTRAKEKKNRPSLLEKLRHDFSKHTSKLVEVSESVEHGSFVGLVQAVQSALLAHLDILSDTWEASLSSSRTKYTDMNWSLPYYCCSAMEYARLFWSLGALEHALTLYDELDRYLFEIVEEMAVLEAGREPRWVVSLRSENLPFRSLFSSFEHSKIDCKKSHSLIAIRHFLVAQQILLSLYLYNARHRSRGAAPSLRVDFAAIILQYAKHVLDVALVQSRTGLMNVSNARLACWSLIISNETLHIAGLLAEPSTLEGAAASVCAIHLQKFLSMLDLSNLSGGSAAESRSLLDWLSVNDSSGSSEYIREMLQSSSNLYAQLTKAYDTATATLLQWGRNRQAVHIGWKMAEWMRKNSRGSGALLMEVRFVSSLISNGCQSEVVVEVMKRVIPHLKNERDYDKLLEYYLFIAVHATNIVDRRMFAEDFIDLVQKRENEKNCMAESVDIFRNLFRVSVTGFTTTVQISNCASIEFDVISSFPIPINSFHLRVKLLEVGEHVYLRQKQPLYDVIFSERDQVCRIVTLNKSHSDQRKLSLCKSDSTSSYNAEDLLLTCSNQLLTPGRNKIAVSGMATARGCFILHGVEAILFDNTLPIDICRIITKRMVTIFVQCMPNRLWISDSKDLLAGVAQRVNVIVEAATSVSCSKLEVYGETSEGVEFLDKDEAWSPKIIVDIPQLQSGARHTFELVLCLLMDAGLTASPAIRKAKICLEWLGRIWSLELPFLALLIMTSSTSMLENKTLFELEIARAVGHAEEWTVMIENAVIEAVDPSAPEGTPNKLGKLINRELEELIPNVVSSLVWVLPICGELPISHKLSIDYRVKPTKGYDLDDGYRKIIDKIYSYRETFDLHVPRVAYELCAQMLSHQPGAQLCRAGAACDLVISLRSMIPYVELLYIVLDADEKLWTLTERAKVLQVKESGLGQIAFSVIPCAAGFLPYPSVSVYSCKNIGPRVSDTWTEGVDIVPGIQLLSFLRTGGKQIRVLSASQTLSESAASKKGLKHKLGKFFD